MYELRTGLYAHKFATFWMLPKRFYHTFVFQITLNALYNQLKANRLARFRKTWNHVNLGKTQCWALFVIYKATFTKTVIKPKFDDRFSLKNFSDVIGHCTTKWPIFVSIETFKLPTVDAKLSKYCSDVRDLDNFFVWGFPVVSSLPQRQIPCMQHAKIHRPWLPSVIFPKFGNVVIVHA